MEDVKTATLKRAIVLLDAVGATYAILTKDGKKYGELKVSQKVTGKYKHGELTGHIREHFKPIEIGDVLVVPVGKFDVTEMQKCLASYSCRVYGKGTHTTCITSDRKGIEILRVA